jgi:hypothetical protein
VVTAIVSWFDKTRERLPPTIEPELAWNLLLVSGQREILTIS